ncbi:MAG: shikimate dehydrogenase [Bacteroidetes bacterium]|nr:shikimate dehydrogenase [Bacteroidota bacterium]
MKKYGLLGKSLQHSFSPAFFKDYFQSNSIDAEYQLLELASIEEARPFLDGSFQGLNVTVPYKESILAYLEELTHEAQAIGAVNTIAFRGGKTLGHNTDAYGFQRSIKPFLTFEHERALLLGTGGSSKAVAHVLKTLGIQVNYVSRETKGPNIFSYDAVNEAMLSACKLIVNCTPVGMYPLSAACPLKDLKGVGERHLVVDLIYHPEETCLLHHAREQGAAVLNGLPMLHAQALKSWEFWNQFD